MSLNIIPLSGQNLDETRDPIRNNFTTINNAFLVNHVEYGLGDQGKHTFITFVQQAAAPVLAGTDGGIWNQPVTGPNPTINGPELWLKKFYDSGTLNFDLPFTASFISNTANASIVNDMPGWSYIPSGLLIKWGSATSNGAAVVTFPVAPEIPGFTNCFAVFVCPGNITVASDIDLGVVAMTALNFTANSANRPLRYIAIGW